LFMSRVVSGLVRWRASYLLDTAHPAIWISIQYPLIVSRK